MAGGWASLGLLDELVRTVEEDFQWMLPTAIQDEAIPLILGGGDVMASAETGSGKTAAFALPITQLCVEWKEQHAKRVNTASQVCQANSTEMPACQMSCLDRDDAISIDPTSGGLRIQSRDLFPRWAGCRATRGVDCTKHVQASFSCKVLDEGTVRVGWATADASLNLGLDGEGWGYGSTGFKVHKSKYIPYGRYVNDDQTRAEQCISFTKGDVITCYLETFSDAWNEDSEHKSGPVVVELSFSKNGRLIGRAFEVRKQEINDTVLYPAVCLKNAECMFQFTSKSIDVEVSLSPSFIALGELDASLTAMNPRDTVSVIDATQEGPIAIIIEPTRELAKQTCGLFEDLTRSVKDTSIKAALLVGGSSPKTTLAALKQNEVDILVGTPPILASYMKKRDVLATRCRVLVLDEADGLILSDFVKSIEVIFGRILAATGNKSRFERLQVCFFSATLEGKEVQQLAETVCHRPLYIKLHGHRTGILPDAVQHLIINIDPQTFPSGRQEFLQTDYVHRGGDKDKAVTLDGLSKKEANSEKIKQLKIDAVLAIIDKLGMGQVLIFCRTALDCNVLENIFVNVRNEEGVHNKYECRVLTGRKDMKDRKKSLDDFNNGEARILIATDIASRGLNIRDLPFVINFTLPNTVHTYVHRSGRVGRASCIGLTISLVGTQPERVWFCQPGKEPPDQDTRDYELGGNCIWYDEPKLLGEVQKLLEDNHTNFTVIGFPFLQLPTEIACIIENKGYGEKLNNETFDPNTQSAFNRLRDQALQADISESNLQLDYWGLQIAVAKASSSLRR